MKVSTDNYYVYIITNTLKTVLYIGVTNNLPQRIIEHYLNKGKTETFAGRYNCHQLIYYEFFKYVNEAIAREKELKKWSRQKKQDLITVFNPKWDNLNHTLFDEWPPRELFHRKNV